MNNVTSSGVLAGVGQVCVHVCLAWEGRLFFVTLFCVLLAVRSLWCLDVLGINYVFVLGLDLSDTCMHFHCTVDEFHVSNGYGTDDAVTIGTRRAAWIGFHAHVLGSGHWALYHVRANEV